jgi:diaminobutyrate-2-oxoglutarate transaminase
MMQGLEMPSGDHAARVVEVAFSNGLVIETSGPWSEVVKVLAPLTIEPEELDEGLEILADAISLACKEGVSS